MKTNQGLTPLLIVRGAAEALDFYVRALDARVLERYEHGAERRLSHAELVIADAPFAVTEEARGWNSDAPDSLGGTQVVLQLCVRDADAVLESMRDAGATVVFPARELFGERMARVRDPFGHVWLLRQRLQELSMAEIQRQRDALFARARASALLASGTPAPTHLEDERILKVVPAAPQDPDASLEKRPPLPAARVHLVVGPVGAGKSIYALELARVDRAVRYTLDDWMEQLFSRDRPVDGVREWYVDRAERCVTQIWANAQQVAGAGTSVVLELGLLSRDNRESFYHRIEEAGFAPTIHVVDASRDVRRERVEERNRVRGPTFSMVVPPAIFELASDLWESPAPLECSGRDVRFVRTD